MSKSIKVVSVLMLLVMLLGVLLVAPVYLPMRGVLALLAGLLLLGAGLYMLSCKFGLRRKLATFCLVVGLGAIALVGMAATFAQSVGVIMPSTSVVITSSSSSMTKVQAQLVRAFYGDSVQICSAGTSNQQVKLNMAITALPAGGGSVYINAGTVTVNGNTNLASDVFIEGTGDSTLITFANGTTGSNMFVGTSLHNFAVRHVKLNGNRDLVTWAADCTKLNGFLLTTCVDFHLEYITFDDFRSDPIRIGTNSTRGWVSYCSSFNTSANQNYDHIVIANSTYITVDHNYLERKGCGVYVDNSDYCSVVYNKICSINDGEPIFNIASSYNDLSHNILIGKQTYTGDMLFISGAGCTAEGNIIDCQNNATGISAGTDGGEDGDDAIIAKNRIYNPKPHGVVIGPNSSGCAVNTNYVFSADTWGIIVYGYATTVTGDVVSGSGAGNIRLQGNAHRSTITACHSSNNIASGGIQVYGVNYCTVTANTCYNDSNCGIYNTGSWNTFTANTVEDCVSVGIYQTAGNYNKYTANTANYVAAGQTYGILLNGGTGCGIINNIAHGNTNGNIFVAAACVSITIADNDLRGAGAAISNASSTTVIRGNMGYINAGEIRTWSGSLTKTGSTLTNLTGTFTGSPITLLPGANTVTCTVAGTATIVLPTGSTGTCASDTMTVTASPVALVAGSQVIEATGVPGTITVTINSWTFAIRNPEAQDCLIDSILVEESTAGGTATSVCAVGIADDATGTNLGAEFFTAIPMNAALVYSSTYAADTGTQVKPVIWQDNASATDSWVVGQISTQIANNLVAKYYITYRGR